MKLKHSLLALLSAAMMIPAAQATVDSSVTNLNLTVRVQGESVEKGDVVTSKIGTFRLGAKQVIELLENLFEEDYPTGAKLFVTSSGDVLIVTNKGEYLDDVTGYVTVDYDSPTYITKGNYNFETDQENSANQFLVWLSINISENSKVPVATGESSEGIELEAGGIAKENFVASKPTNNGSQTYTGHITANLAGWAYVDGEEGVTEGSVALSGKETNEAE